MAETDLPRGPGRPSNESLLARAMEQQAESNRLIAETLGALQANTPPREIGFGDPEYQARLRAEGIFTELEKPAFQNGRDIEPRGLTPDTIYRLARLAPGRYVNKMVEVEVDAKDRRHLKYRSASIEDRMKQPWKSLDELVAMVWEEMAVPA